MQLLNIYAHNLLLKKTKSVAVFPRGLVSTFISHDLPVNLISDRYRPNSPAVDAKVRKATERHVNAARLCAQRRQGNAT